MTAFNIDFARVGSEAEKELNSGNPEITPPADDNDDDPVVPPADDTGDDDPVEDPADSGKTIVANYTSKQDVMTGLIMKVDFYSDGTWLAYDDIRAGETSGDENGNTESTESSLLYVDLYKGTYTGKPAEDGKFAIVTTHNTYISNLRYFSTIEMYFTELEKQMAQIGKDTAAPVRFTDSWLSSSKDEKEVTVTNGKITLFDTDLYKDGKYEEETSGNQNEPETSEESKEVAARFLGKDDVGKIFIELYKDGTFLEYDVIDFGEGVSMLLDLYKGTYEGKPAEDGIISFNITHMSTMLGQSYESQFAQMEAQLSEADENTVYPMKFKGEWKEITTSAAVIVKNGRTKVLGFDVVREGVPTDDPLFDSWECTVSVDSVVLADGNWTMRMITDQDHLFTPLKAEERDMLLNNFSGSDKNAVEALITKNLDDDDYYIIVPGEKMVQAATYKLVLKDKKVSATTDVSSYSVITVKETLHKDIIDYMANNFKNILYEWNGNTGTCIQILSDEELTNATVMGQYMLEQALKQDNWKSNTDGSKYFSLDGDTTIYLEKK